MEWQCNLPSGWYGAFVSTPVHCMIPIAQSRFYLSNVGKPEPWSFGNGNSSMSSSFAASRAAYTLPRYREDDGWYGRDADWNDWDEGYKRRISDGEATQIKTALSQFLDRSKDCRDYTKRLIERLASNSGVEVVSSNLEELLKIVLESRRITATGADEGGVFILGSNPGGSTHSIAKNNWEWVGAPGWAQLDLEWANRVPQNISELPPWEQSTLRLESIQTSIDSPSSISTLVHELFHVAIKSRSGANDVALATAASQLAGKELDLSKYREYFGPDVGDNQIAGQIANRYLQNACGFPVSVSEPFNDITNY